MLELISQHTDSDLPSKNTVRYWISANYSFSSTKQSGKWCVFLKQSRVDSVWELIKQRVFSNDFVAAKVSTKLFHKKTKRRGYVVCVYTKDWEDQTEVFRIKDELMKLGVTEVMKYKRDIDTMNGKNRFVYK